MTDQESAPLVQNISLENPPQPEPKMKDPRKDRTQEGLSLPEPFSQRDMQDKLGLTSGGANSQVRRWQYWGWIQNEGYGKYRRTANFGGSKKQSSMGTKFKQRSRAPGRVTSKGYPVTAQLACDVPGCNFIGYGSTETNALRSVGRHKSMEHGIKKKYLSAKERRKLGYSRSTQYIIPRAEHEQNGAVTPAPAPPPPEHHIKFCPECGFNIQMHEISYRIARKHRREG